MGEKTTKKAGGFFLSLIDLLPLCTPRLIGKIAFLNGFRGHNSLGKILVIDYYWIQSIYPQIINTQPSCLCSSHAASFLNLYLNFNIYD